MHRRCSVKLWLYNTVHFFRNSHAVFFPPVIESEYNSRLSRLLPVSYFSVRNSQRIFPTVVVWAFPEMPCHSRGDALRFCLLTEDEEGGGQDAEKLQLKSYSCQARNGGE